MDSRTKCEAVVTLFTNGICLTAPAAIMEIDEANVVLFAIADEVFAREILGFFLQESHQRIRAHRNLRVAHNTWNK